MPRLKEKVELTEDMLLELWNEQPHVQRGYAYSSDRYDFEQLLHKRYSNVDDVSWCGDCQSPSIDQEDWVHVNGGGHQVCGSCIEEYSFCEDCSEYVSNYDVINGNTVCDSCRDYNYAYCEHCEEYFHNDDNHDTEHNCDCEAPAQSFKIRNDGKEPLSNDEQMTVTLPVGTISDEGIYQISRAVVNADSNRDESGSRILPGYVVQAVIDKLDRSWQMKQGNFTKRLSRAFYQYNKTKISPDVLSQIGNIAQAHSSDTSELHIEITRNLNLPAYEFAHSDSCWWGGYSNSRCALKNNGGFGLRSFGSDHYGRDSVTGRAWVMPMKMVETRYDGRGLVPTFNTETPDAFVVFNGYGDLDGYTPARIMAHLAGMTYKKIGFECSPMYVNAGGYLISSQEIVNDIESINLSVDDHAQLHYVEEREARENGQ